MKKQYKFKPKLRNTSPKSENSVIFTSILFQIHMTLSFHEIPKYLKNPKQ